MNLLKLREAAASLRVSYPTLKQWIYKRKIRSVRTPGGHHRIPQSEIERLLRVGRGTASRRGVRPGVRAPFPGISGRNQLHGIVTAVRSAGLLAQVTLDIGGQTVTSIITRSACRELGLRRGVAACALIKATEVMMLRDNAE